MNKKIHIHKATDCPRRTLDCANIHQFFEENGYVVVNKPNEADDILLVTCAAWDIPEQVSINALEDMKQYKKNLILLGCLSEINKKLLDKHFDGISLPPKNLHLINDLYPHEKDFSNFDKGNDPKTYLSRPFDLQTNETRITDLKNMQRQVKRVLRSAVYYGPVNTFRLVSDLLIRKKEYSLKIAQGCIWRCSYCGVKNAIGDLKSRPIKDCIEEAQEVIQEKGYKRIRIIADDTGSYGNDIGVTCVDLFDKLTRIKGFYTLSLGELNPYWMIKYFDAFNTIFDRKKIISLVIPVQSGSQRILTLMNRNYDVSLLKKNIAKLKKRHKYLHLITHIIAGFPTETEDDVEANLSFIRDVPIDCGVITWHSYRPGTKSSTMKGRLSPDQKNQE